MHHIKVIKDGNVNNVVKEQLVDGVQYVDNEPHEGSLNGITSGAVAKVAGDVGDVKDVIPEGTSEENPLVNETGLGEVAERVTTAEGDIGSIEEKIPSGASSSNKLVTESDLEAAQDSWQSGFTPKGEATVSQIDALTTQSNGDQYIVTDSGTITAGSVAVVAGDTVAWDSENGVWYKVNQYATKTYAQNVAHSIAPEFDPTKPNDEGGYAYYAGTPVMYNGSNYVFTSNKKSGAWDSTVVEKKPLSEAIQLEGVGEAVNEWLNQHPEATTTVEDGSLIESKFSDYLKLQAIKDYVTPEMFGAVGDGVTDDTQALQDAFDSRKPVFLSPKTYLTRGNIVTTNHIFGRGLNSRLKALEADQTYVLKILSRSVHLNNICVQGTGESVADGNYGNCTGIFVDAGVTGLIFNNVFMVCCGKGLHITQTIWDCNFFHLWIYFCEVGIKTDIAMLECKFDTCSLSHNRLEIDLTGGTYITFINCGIGSSTTQRFGKFYSVHCVRFISCNFEEANVDTDGSVFFLEKWDNLLIFDGCYIRRCSKKAGATNTSLFRSNTELSRNVVKFYNSRGRDNSTIDYAFYVANIDLTLQYEFDWRSFVDLLTECPAHLCNLSSNNDTLFAITEVPKLRQIPNLSSRFDGQKFRGFRCVVGNGLLYEYDGTDFRRVVSISPVNFSGDYVLESKNGVVDWIPNPSIYNPLGLPDYTVRFTTISTVTQLDFAKGTLTEIDAQSNTYELYYHNSDWTSVFDGITKLKKILGANLSKVSKLYRTFFGCTNLEVLPLMDTSNVTTFYACFYNCAHLISVPKLLLNKAVNLYAMFHNCNSLTFLPDLDFYVVENCSLIFEDCKNVSDGDSMTSAYSKLSALESATTYGAAFRNCGVNTTDGAAALAQIPASWGGTAT